MTKRPVGGFDSLDKMTDYMMPQTPLQAADVAFLFGSRHGLEEFYQVTMDLWTKGLYKHLVISGGITGNWTDSEASVIKKALMDRGHPEDAILIEEQATNTGQNVEFSLPIIDAAIGLKTVQSVIAIGKISSARRYLMTLEKWWPGPLKMMAPVNYFGVTREKWYDDPEFKRRVLSEFVKIPGYIQQGFIKELSPQEFGERPKGPFDLRP